MASTQTWSEFNGINAAIETDSRVDCNWKSVDDSTTPYSSAAIMAGNNSFSKYQCIKFGGTWNSLGSFTYKVSTTSPKQGVTIVGSVVTVGATPSDTSTGDTITNMTTGISANFVSSTTPYGVGTPSTTSGGVIYVNPLRTQLQTENSAAPGDIPVVTITATWIES